MARKRGRWADQRAGKRRGALSRATGTPAGRPIPKRLMKDAERGKFGRQNKRRASAARRSGR